MVEGPEIRDLELRDIYAREGFFKCLEELAPVNLTKGKAEDIYFTRQHEGCRTLVCVIGDYVIGTASMIIEQKFIHSGGKVAFIEDVAVSSDYQECGIGTMLISELIDIAQQAGCYKAVLYCKDEVVPFYEKLGFHKSNCGMRLDF